MKIKEDLELIFNSLPMESQKQLFMSFLREVSSCISGCADPDCDCAVCAAEEYLDSNEVFCECENRKGTATFPCKSCGWIIPGAIILNSSANTFRSK